MITAEHLLRLGELFHGAVSCLVTGLGGLRERLRRARVHLQDAQELLALVAEAEEEKDLLHSVAGFAERGGRLDSMADDDLVVLANDLWEVQTSIAEMGHRDVWREQGSQGAVRQVGDHPSGT